MQFHGPQGVFGGVGGPRGGREIPVVHVQQQPSKPGGNSPAGTPRAGTPSGSAREIPIRMERSDSPRSASGLRGGSQTPPRAATPGRQQPQPGWSSHVFPQDPGQQQPAQFPTYPRQPEPTAQHEQPRFTYTSGPATRPDTYFTPAGRSQQTFQTEPQQLPKFPNTAGNMGNASSNVNSGQSWQAPAFQQPPTSYGQQAPATVQPEISNRGISNSTDLHNEHKQEDTTPVKVPQDHPGAAKPNLLSPGEGGSTPQRGRSPSPGPPLPPLERAQNIVKEAQGLQQRVESFTGHKADKEYIYLEEMLTRLLIKLDNIDSEGREDIRSARRQGVKIVQATLDQLELKAFANETNVPSEHGEPMQMDSGESKGMHDLGNKGSWAEEQMQTQSDGGSGPNRNAPVRVKDLVLDSEISC